MSIYQGNKSLMNNRCCNNPNCPICNGNPVNQKSRHCPRPVGPTGPTGPKGSQGIPGCPGPQGPPGRRGDPGPQGDPGCPGPNGPKGNPGAVGPMGPQGLRGPRGDIGAMGCPGPAGPEGPQGERGPEGAPGIIGPEGSQGPLGPQGPRGPQGCQGSEGPQGERGYPGATGSTGPTGPTGPTGAAATLVSAQYQLCYPIEQTARMLCSGEPLKLNTEITSGAPHISYNNSTKTFIISDEGRYIINYTAYLSIISCNSKQQIELTVDGMTIVHHSIHPNQPLTFTDTILIDKKNSHLGIVMIGDNIAFSSDSSDVLDVTIWGII